MDVVAATPKGYEPNANIVAKAQAASKETGATISTTNDPLEAVAHADVIYTDVWASMGFEEEQKEREQAFAPFQVNENLVQAAKSDFIFLHCLPAHREEEVTSTVIDGPHSYIYDQAENRLHAQKAILISLLT